MATLRNKRQLAAMATETPNYPTNNQSQNSSALGITEEYIAQVCEEIEGGATKKLSQEIDKTESGILGALSKIDKFLLNQQIWKFSETVQGTFWNANVENEQPNRDRFQNDSHPEVDFSACRAGKLTDSDPDDTPRRINQETTHRGFAVSWVVFPGCFRNGCGENPNLRVENHFFKFRQSTQNTWLRPIKFLR